MAYVAKYIAGITSGDSAKQKRAVAIAVTEAKAKLWFAAADQTAREATDVGLLLKSLNDAQESDGTNSLYSWYVHGEYFNDAYAPPANDADVYNSNRIKLTYSTTNNGIPVTESIYIPQRWDGLPVNPDGKSYDISAAPFTNMNTQLVATGRSSYGTAITGIVEAIPNDV